MQAIGKTADAEVRGEGMRCGWEYGNFILKGLQIPELIKINIHIIRFSLINSIRARFSGGLYVRLVGIWGGGSWDYVR
jgi:hypothetical protein